MSTETESQYCSKFDCELRIKLFGTCSCKEEKIKQEIVKPDAEIVAILSMVTGVNQF